MTESNEAIVKLGVPLEDLSLEERSDICRALARLEPLDDGIELTADD